MEQFGDRLKRIPQEFVGRDPAVVASARTFTRDIEIPRLLIDEKLVESRYSGRLKPGRHLLRVYKWSGNPLSARYEAIPVSARRVDP